MTDTRAQCRTPDFAQERNDCFVPRFNCKIAFVGSAGNAKEETAAADNFPLWRVPGLYESHPHRSRRCWTGPGASLLQMRGVWLPENG